MRQAIEHANRHIDSFHRYLDRPLDEAVLFEFGAGWDLPIQLLFFARGASRQVIVDQNRLIRKELVNDSIKRIREMGLDSLERLPDRTIEVNLEKELRESYGIDYRAPCDARNTGCAHESVDLVTSTETLQHIPVPDLFQILSECHRILKPGGLITASITYDDHYSFSDKQISAYNFLRYSDDAWQLYNPPNHYQNRLRHVETHRSFPASRFSTVRRKPEARLGCRLELLARMSIDSRFRRCSLEELAVHESHLVFVKDAVHGDSLAPSRRITSGGFAEARHARSLLKKTNCGGTAYE